MKNSLKIITIVGDSLSMVRPSEGINYRDTYPFILQNMLGEGYHIVVRNRRSNDSQIQSHPQHIQDDVLFNDSEYVILHFGIVDCAPRLMTRKETLFLKVVNIKFITEKYIGFKSRYRRFFTKHFQWTRVSQERFRENMNYLVDSIKNNNAAQKIIIINIADTNERSEYRSYGYKRNILKFNNSLKPIVENNKEYCLLINFFEESNGSQKLMAQDGMHLLSPGHSFLADKLYKLIINLENERHQGVV